MDVIKAAVHLGPKAQDTLAISLEGTSHTYAHLLRSALSIATDLKAIITAQKHVLDENNGSHEIEPPRIGIIAKPCAQFVAGIWATWLCHGISVPLALSHPEAELLHVLTDADVSVVLSTADYEARLKDVCEKASCELFQLPDVTNDRQNEMETNETLEHVLARVLKLSSIKDDASGLIIYTSGTTGKPKGAVHTHSGMNSQVKMLSQAWQYVANDRFLNTLPLHHVHGLFNSLLAPLYVGAMVEFLPKFSVKGVWKRWSESYPSEDVKEANAITVFTGVPTMYAYLLQGFKSMDGDAQKVAASAAQQLRLMMSGSSALPLPVMKEWEKLTGHRLLERYGMTEFVMALSNPCNGERKAGTVGKPLPGVQVKVIEDSTEPGFGELYVKSPSMFKTYWKNPEAMKDSFTEDGYFKTGDSVTTDKDGYYIILGRSSVDILKVGGFKLSALEIQNVLLEHPAIAECAILGLPDEYYGEVICAVVTLTEEVKSGTNSTEDDPKLSLPQLQAWSKDRLAPYKIPSRLVIWESMPLNAMGKVNKKELKRLLTN